MAVPTVLTDFSATAANNSPTGGETIGSSLDDYLRGIQAVTRHLANASSNVASAATADIGAATTNYVVITGTVTITSLGTVAAGIWRYVRFSGALTLTHNGTSLILPGAADIVTVAGDTALFVSEGSGNWRCFFYAGVATTTGSTSSTFTFNGSGGTSSAVTLTWQKIGKWVTLNIPTVSATSGTASTTFISDTAIAAAARPTSLQYVLGGAPLNNASSTTTPSMIQINTNGTINIARDCASTAYTNSSTCGTAGNLSVTYYTG